MHTDFELGIELVNIAYQQRSDERLFQRWCAMYQNNMSFDEFKDKLGTKTSAAYNEPSKSTSEIMANVEKIVEAVHNGNI